MEYPYLSPFSHSTTFSSSAKKTLPIKSIFREITQIFPSTQSYTPFAFQELQIKTQ